MVYDIQKAGIVRRLSAWLLDTILLCVLAVGCAWVIGAVVDYDGVAAQLDTYYTQYETQYNVDFECLPQDYDAETEDDRLAYQQRYEEAEAALVAGKTEGDRTAVQSVLHQDQYLHVYSGHDGAVPGFLLLFVLVVDPRHSLWYHDLVHATTLGAVGLVQKCIVHHPFLPDQLYLGSPNPRVGRTEEGIAYPDQQ